MEALAAEALAAEALALMEALTLAEALALEVKALVTFLGAVVARVLTIIDVRIRTM